MMLVVYISKYFSKEPGSKSKPEEIHVFTDNELQALEEALGIYLPGGYKSFLKADRDAFAGEIGNQTIFDDVDQIVGFAYEYRKGFTSCPPWPKNYIYVGDEMDACPYVLNTETEELIRTNKGWVNDKPLEKWNSFSDFIHSMQKSGADSTSKNLVIEV